MPDPKKERKESHKFVSKLSTAIALFTSHAVACGKGDLNIEGGEH